MSSVADHHEYGPTDPTAPLYRESLIPSQAPSLEDVMAFVGDVQNDVRADDYIGALTQAGYQVEGNGQPVATEFHTVLVGNRPLRYEIRKPFGSQSNDILLIGPGFCGTQACYSELADALVNRYGKTVALFEPNRDEGPGQLTPGRFVHNLVHSETLLAKESAAILKDIFNRDGGVQFDVFSHSMHGPAVLNMRQRVAKQRPEIIVNNIVLAGSAGLTKHNLASLTRPIVTGLVGNLSYLGDHALKELPLAPDSRAMARYLLHAQTIIEALGVSRAKSLEDIRAVRQLGTKVMALVFENDDVFSAEQTRQRAGHLLDLILEVPNANHYAPQRQPLKVAEAVVTGLDLLTKSKQHKFSLIKNS